MESVNIGKFIYVTIVEVPIEISIPLDIISEL